MRVVTYVGRATARLRGADAAECGALPAAAEADIAVAIRRWP